MINSKRLRYIAMLAAGSIAPCLVVFGAAGVAHAQFVAPAASHADQTVACPADGWSPIAPKQCAQGDITSSVAALASPALTGGNGCDGYTSGTISNEMACRDTATDVNGFRMAIRNGYWNPAAEPTGFGWSKAFYYHNLEMQPIIDTIRLALDPTGSLSSEDYTVYHYTNGELDQMVTVVADLVAKSYAGVSTGDDHVLGVLTGYCNTAAGAVEQDCPDWVNTTL
jgi:hypothetical protein